MFGKSVFAKSVQAAMAAVVAAGALAGCGGTQKPGTAALVGDDRITVTELSQTVRDWREQFRTDPAANQMRASPANPAPQLAGDSESDVRGALTLLINFRVAAEVAEDAGVEITRARVDDTIGALNQQGGAETVTLASGLPRDRTRGLARLVATQVAMMERFGADRTNPMSPATQQAGQKWNELFRRTADDMKVEVNPRYGTYDPGKFLVGPVDHRLSKPDSGT
ncbi:SurA N-terminal domain-containing protein [Actinomadura sp. 7K507]|uniref:SurA N-terminal domain-containing protein n=1 Tax=Actinomadura sp. 7K507 TaxID=2530365 RepID=UPI00104E561D|nr:SurA N-terminal domain-containing protein [Actinomadura sp. 7K507]TDC97389.1 hypothetical protein E1285_03815 [Actinomadura sp. 7K507]